MLHKNVPVESSKYIGAFNDHFLAITCRGGIFTGCFSTAQSSTARHGQSSSAQEAAEWELGGNMLPPPGGQGNCSQCKQFTGQIFTSWISFSHLKQKEFLFERLLSTIFTGNYINFDMHKTLLTPPPAHIL